MGMRDRSECVSWPNEGFLLVRCMAGLSAPAEPEAGFHGQVQEMSGLAIDGPLTCQSPAEGGGGSSVVEALLDVGRRARSSAPACPWHWEGHLGQSPSLLTGSGPQEEHVDLFSRLEAGGRLFEPPLSMWEGTSGSSVTLKRTWRSGGCFNVFVRTLTSESPTRPRRCFWFSPRAVGCTVQSFCSSLIRFVVSRPLTRSKSATRH